MIRNYTNKKIYRNVKIAKVLAVISIPLSILAIIGHFLSQEYGGFQSAGMGGGGGIVLCFFILLTPISILSIVRNQCKKTPLQQLQESTMNNDFANTVAAIILSLYCYWRLSCRCYLCGMPKQSVFGLV